MISKDFYIDTHFLCGLRSTENIFDLPENIFDSVDVFDYERSVKIFIKSFNVTPHLWPWMWRSSDMTDEVYIYEMNTGRFLYYDSNIKEFFDAKLIRQEQNLQGCEIFDCTFKFPLMHNIPPVITAMQGKGQSSRSMTIHYE